MKRAFKLMQGFALPLVVYVLIRLWKIRRRRDELVVSLRYFFPGHLLSGLRRPYVQNKQTFARGLHSDGNPVAHFLVSQRLFHSVADPRVIREQVPSTSDVVSPDVNLKSLQSCFVRASLRELRNWDLASVEVRSPLQDIVLPSLLTALTSGKDWNSQYGHIRSLLVSKSTEIPPETELSDVLSFMGMKERESNEKRDLLHHLSNVLARLEPDSRSNITGEHGMSEPEQVAAVLLETFYLTVSIAMWMLYSLASCPTEQDEVLREIDSRIGRRMPPTFKETESLIQLHFLAVETMRVHNPIPLMETKLKNNVELDGELLNAGSSAVLAVAASNTSAKNFDAPYDIDTARLVTDLDYDRKFLPPPSPSLDVALVLAKTFIVIVLQRFRVRRASDPVEGGAFERGFSLPGDSFACTFEVRTTSSTL